MTSVVDRTATSKPVHLVDPATGEPYTAAGGGGSTEVQGVDATGEAPTGKPVQVGGVSTGSGNVTPAAVSDDGEVYVTAFSTQPLPVSEFAPNFYASAGAAGLTGFRVNYNTSGDKTLVAAISGQTTRVHRLKLNAAGTVVVQVKNGAGAVLEAFNFIAGGGIVLDLSGVPWYTTSTNTALILNLSANVQVDGLVEYLTTV